MSKIIKVTQEILDEAKANFENLLKEGKFADGKINYTYQFKDLDRKASLTFTEIAWLKMQALIQEFSTEIAWHGIVYRLDNDEYLVDDIVVFPQLVSGATVDRDIEAWAKWNMTLDDETFTNMKMHGHSHVNMGVTPSSTDTNFYNTEILPELGEDSFYVFVIWNKRNDHTVKIYDYAKNIFFDDKDVDVYIMNDGLGVRDIVADAKAKLKDKPAVVAKSAVTTTAVTTKSDAKGNTPKYKRKETQSYSSYPSYQWYDDDDWDAGYNPDYAYHGRCY